eukprot:TRINITY_DN2730_c0_g1_i6.p1 TRINITY_DN2730_c0_g1~~TRINITY_DN2730_c0_g1_i6.p1  ORF type:complete len:917 (+),score=262.60 TRINITY_DN2730_c0_g1_i6:471-3221(+)
MSDQMDSLLSMMFNTLCWVCLRTRKFKRFFHQNNLDAETISNTAEKLQICAEKIQMRWKSVSSRSRKEDRFPRLWEMAVRYGEEFIRENIHPRGTHSYGDLSTFLLSHSFQHRMTSGDGEEYRWKLSMDLFRLFAAGHSRLSVMSTEDEILKDSHFIQIQKTVLHYQELMESLLNSIVGGKSIESPMISGSEDDDDDDDTSSHAIRDRHSTSTSTSTSTSPSAFTITAPHGSETHRHAHRRSSGSHHLRKTGDVMNLHVSLADVATPTQPSPKSRLLDASAHTHSPPSPTLPQRPEIGPPERSHVKSTGKPPRSSSSRRSQRRGETEKKDISSIPPPISTSKDSSFSHSHSHPRQYPHPHPHPHDHSHLHGKRDPVLDTLADDFQSPPKRKSRSLVSNATQTGDLLSPGIPAVALSGFPYIVIDDPTPEADVVDRMVRNAEWTDIGREEIRRIDDPEELLSALHEKELDDGNESLKSQDRTILRTLGLGLFDGKKQDSSADDRSQSQSMSASKMPKEDIPEWLPVVTRSVIESLLAYQSQHPTALSGTTSLDGSPMFGPRDPRALGLNHGDHANGMSEGSHDLDGAADSDAPPPVNPDLLALSYQTAMSRLAEMNVKVAPFSMDATPTKESHSHPHRHAQIQRKKSPPPIDVPLEPVHPQRGAASHTASHTASQLTEDDFQKMLRNTSSQYQSDKEKEAVRPRRLSVDDIYPPTPTVMDKIYLHDEHETGVPESKASIRKKRREEKMRTSSSGSLHGRRSDAVSTSDRISSRGVRGISDAEETPVRPIHMIPLSKIPHSESPPGGASPPISFGSRYASPTSPTSPFDAKGRRSSGRLKEGKSLLRSSPVATGHGMKESPAMTHEIEESALPHAMIPSSSPPLALANPSSSSSSFHASRSQAGDSDQRRRRRPAGDF